MTVSQVGAFHSFFRILPSYYGFLTDMLKSGQMSDPAALAEEEVMVGLAAPSQLMICAATEEDIVMEEYSSPNSCASASMAILRDSAYGSDVNEGIHFPYKSC